MTHPPEELLNLTQAAAFAGVHPRTIQKWSKQGKLKYKVQNGTGRKAWSKSVLEQFVRFESVEVGK